MCIRDRVKLTKKKSNAVTSRIPITSAIPGTPLEGICGENSKPYMRPKTEQNTRINTIKEGRMPKSLSLIHI